MTAITPTAAFRRRLPAPSSKLWMMTCANDGIYGIMQVIGVRVSVKSAAAHAEFFRGFSAAPAAFLQGPGDQLLFRFLDGDLAVGNQFTRGAGILQRFGSKFRREIAAADLFGTSEDNGAFDRTAQ